jgi:hypothetical protein
VTDPYATPEPLPYDPENPETLPYDALPPPERIYLTAQEAIDGQGPKSLDVAFAADGALGLTLEFI